MARWVSLKSLVSQRRNCIGAGEGVHCTATRPRLCAARTQLSAPLVSASSILQSPESQFPTSPPRAEQRWPASLSNTPFLRSLHTRLLSGSSCQPAFLQPLTRPETRPCVYLLWRTTPPFLLLPSSRSVGMDRPLRCS